LTTFTVEMTYSATACLLRKRRVNVKVSYNCEEYNEFRNEQFATFKQQKTQYCFLDIYIVISMEKYCAFCWPECCELVIGSVRYEYYKVCNDPSRS
jgi:hypothetical protein